MLDRVKELRQAARRLRRAPGFTAVIVLTLGLGIGANTAIFSVVRTVLLRPLPYPEPERLVLVWGELTARDVDEFPSSPPMLRDYEERGGSFERLAGGFAFGQALTGLDGEPEQVDVAGVTPDFFRTLGASPALGRDFLPEDAVPAPPQDQAFPGGSPATVAILGHGLWQRRFGGDPAVVGTSVELDGNATRIVGVMPRDFRLLLPPAAGFPETIDIWVAPRIDYDAWPYANVAFTVVGRLAEGTSRERAQADMDGVAASLREKNQTLATAGFELEVASLQGDLTAPVRPLILALLGAVGFLLLIACANVSNLLLVRALGRGREMAVRAALGAGRRRLLRPVLLEGGLLAALGGLLGLLVAHGGVRLLLHLRPDDLPRLTEIGVDGVVLAFTLGLCVLVALLAGTLPALHASRVNLADSLRERSEVGGGGTSRLARHGMVVLEVTLALALLIGAGLMVRSFAALQGVDPGYDPEKVLAFDLNLPNARYETPEERTAFVSLLEERIRGLPGVRAVASAFPIPLDPAAFTGRYGTSEVLEDESAWRQAAYRVVRPDYFHTMGTPVLEGRGFTPADEADSAAVVVVDRKLAKRTWPGESAVGKRMLVRVTSTEPQWVDVIGVVDHQRAETLAAEGRETVYFTHRFTGAFGLTWLVRADGPPERLIGPIRGELASLDPLLPLADVKTMEEVVAEAMGPTRFAMTLIGAFAALALALAAVGLYGVLAYTVRQRTPEIGIRMAFGAPRDRVVALVMRKGMLLTGVGILGGVGLSFLLTRTLESLLVGVTPTDPLTFVSIVALFALVSAAACWIPAARAARVDPLVALRQE